MSTHTGFLEDALIEALYAAARSEQEVVLDREYWGRNRENGRALLAGLGLDMVENSAETIALLARVKDINRRVHDGRATMGAPLSRDLVAAAQGGMYCRMCGIFEDLQVDHITPTSQGGSQDAMKNLQLLCSRCNRGKGGSACGQLGPALTTTTDRTVTPARFYLRLYLTSTMQSGRPLGRCDQGHSASEGRLYVEPNGSLAANLPSLIVLCDKER